VTATSGAGAGAETRPEPAASDAEIIARSQRDGQAFAALFDRHAVAIHRYLARRIGLGTADDLLAQTFLVAFERRGSYDLERPDAGAWLYGIATNLLRRQHRDEARLYRALTRVAAGAGSRGGSGCDADAMADRVAERVDAGALSRQLAAALAGLKPPDRDVLLLYSWADLGYHEIALALNIPVGTVRSRLHRARVAVRAALGLPAPSLETN
jgi:RNA polymerase sigma factor (sigma-70 family)